MARGLFRSHATPDSEAAAINDRGQVVGWSHVTSGDERAFLWHEMTPFSR